MKYNAKYVRSRIPVYLVFLFIACNYTVKIFFMDITLTAEEFELYKKIMFIDKPLFILNEIIILAFVFGMALDIWIKRKDPDRFCTSHVLALFTLSLFPITNLIALSTKLDYTFYNSILTQIGICSLTVTVVFLLIYKK